MESTLLNKGLRVAPPVLVSAILHAILLIVLALWLIKLAEPTPLAVLTWQEAEEFGSELITDAIEIEAEAAPAAAAEFALTRQALPVESFGEVAAMSLFDGLDGTGNEQGMAWGGDGIGEQLDGLEEKLSGQDRQYDDEFAYKIRQARQNGLDIVLVFDSTSSMASEIGEVRDRIGAIGAAVLDKIPSTRISLVTYRDYFRPMRPRHPQEYVVVGIPLTDRLNHVDDFLNGVSAVGGGDWPEAVKVGMQWAVGNNSFRTESQKVMLIFGDAPPHKRDMATCTQIAHAFQEGGGRVSTITCRRTQPLTEFYLIARAGGGEAHILADARWLFEELLVLAFGTKHRKDVLRFFELDGK